MNFSHIHIARTWLDRALEASWLAAIVVVLLITLPESEFITLIGLPKTVALRIIASLTVIIWLGHGAVWLTERALFERLESEDREPGASGINGVGWVVWSSIAFAAVVVGSTLLSIDPAVSLWGKRAGYEGYGLYSTFSLLALFFTVAFKLNNKAQLWRLFGTLAAVGLVTALIGIAQHFDLWIVRERIYSSRISGHSGNPIAFGSLLLFLFPVAVIVVTKWGRGQKSSLYLWVSLFAVHFVFIYAVGLTLSRGPYVGMATTMIALPVLLAVFGGVRFASRLAAVSLVSVLVVAFLLLPGNQGLTGSLELVGEPESIGETEDVIDRVTNSGTITNRLQIWEASGDLIINRPAVPEGSGPDTRFLRDLIGYGPDQFRYVVGLTADGATFERRISEAHNDFINRIVEIGWLGLVTFLAVIAAALVSLFSTIKRSRRTSDFTLTLISAALIAALMGRMAEQLVGVPRNSDLLIFWVLLGVVVALPRLSLSSPSTGQETLLKARTRMSFPVFPSPRYAAGYASMMLIALLGIGAFTGFTWQKNMNYLLADHEARVARDAAGDDHQQALGHYEAATSLAPDVAKYRVELGNYYGMLADTASSQSERMSFLRTNYALDISAVEINRLDRDSNFQLAESAWRLAVAGDVEKLDVAIDRYRFITQIAPNYELAHDRLLQLENVSAGLVN